MNAFYLHQELFQNGRKICDYVRPMLTYSSPTLDMLFCTTNNETVRKVQEICVLVNGGVIVSLVKNSWRVGENDGDDVSSEDWPDLFESEVNGWFAVTDVSDLPANPMEFVHGMLTTHVEE